MERILRMVAFTALLLCALSLPYSSPSTFRRHNRMLRGRPVDGLVPKEKEGSYQVDAASTYDLFTQTLDHFNSSNTATWNQQFWYNKAWFQSEGPAFLMIGGEGPETGYWAESASLQWIKMAKDHGAMVFLLEHRFYGNSTPTSDISDSSLQYLSSAQAIEDVASFIRGMKQQFPEISNAKWVTFGGSYSGALSAWARVKHPELVFAAVGSSGPVQAEFDFTEYLEVVQSSIGKSSPQCAQSVRDGFSQVAALSQSAAGRKSLENVFTVCGDGFDWSNNNNVRYFWEAVLNTYMEIVQYSNDNVGIYKSDLTIDNAICRFHNMNNVGALQKMKMVNDNFGKLREMPCIYVDYKGFIDFLKLTSLGGAQNERAWYWQTCTEFGFFQSTDSTSAGPFFGGMENVPVDYYLKECTEIFGEAFSSNAVQQSVDRTNQYYGGRDNMVGSNIVLPNGSIDPWHSLGKLQSTNSSEILPIMIDGTAHCADMYPSTGSDPQSLTLSRNRIASTIAKWIYQN